MPLSEDEERILNEIEDQLYETDPDLAREVSETTVYTHPLSQGGASNSHYNGNAQTYMDIGIAMGKSMLTLLKQK